MEHKGIEITAFDVKHLPIITVFAHKLGFIEEIDSRIKGEMEISPGRVVLAMVLDALSGRSPLFRLHEFFEGKDTELLLGEKIDPSQLNDRTLGRVLDRLYEYGTQKIFTPIAVKGCSLARITQCFFHADTSSIRVWGDFNPRIDDPFLLVRGYSKDKRPDLKQFIFSLLTVKGGLPIRFSCEDGNASDKTINHDVLSLISDFLSSHSFPGIQAFIADSALITAESLQLLQGVPFITRLPANYNEHARVISAALRADTWQEIGSLAQERGTLRRPLAHYRAYESDVVLYGQDYRAIVYHSSAHDARRQKRLDRQLVQDKQAVAERCKKVAQQEFFCEPDALTAAQAIEPGQFHTVRTRVVEHHSYGRGRPRLNGPREPVKTRYLVETEIVADHHALTVLRQEEGCFVLLAQQLDPVGDSGLDARGVLESYKEQYVIEKNFEFLKDPMILDSLFLKTAQRIEALGLVLVIALLLWRLIQYLLREAIQETGRPVEGWKGKPTEKPTSFMMTTKFSSVNVIVINGIRHIGRPLTDAQKGYLARLNLTADIFTAFPGKPPPPRVKKIQRE